MLNNPTMILRLINNLILLSVIFQITDCQFDEYTPPTIYLNRNWILCETDPVGYVVERVQVKEKDQYRLEYGLEISSDSDETSSQMPLPFFIDKSTGVITLNQTLKGRGGQTISLYVTVSDRKFTAKSEVYTTIQSVKHAENEKESSTVADHHGNAGLLETPTVKSPLSIFTSAHSKLSLRTRLETELLNINIRKLNRTNKNDQLGVTNFTLHSKVGFNITSDQDLSVTWVPVFIVCISILCLGIGLWACTKWYFSTTKFIQASTWNITTSNLSNSRIQNDSFDSNRLQIRRKYNNHCQVWKSNKKIHFKRTDDKWEFPRHRLKVFTILGEGCFGQVWKCEALKMNSGAKTTIVAVKTLKENATEREKIDFMEELEIMKNLEPHPNVIRLLGCCTDRDPIFAILEYINGGTLQSFLRTYREGRVQGYHDLTSQDLTSFVYQIAKGMENLASKNIIHRDLAARNILIDGNRVCKVADFGFARDVTANQIYERKSEGRLPIRWMAPESLFENIFSVKSDVWSFGILIWEIVTLGSTPYSGLNATEVIKRMKEDYRLERPEHCKRELYNIMYYCWDKEPSCRPSFSELVMLSEGLLLNETDYIELDRFPNHSYYNVFNLSGEKL